MTKAMHAWAKDFRENVAYQPEVRPGYTAWVSLFPFGNGDLGLAFNEIRRGPNPVFKPVPLAFFKAMKIPYRYGPTILHSSSRDKINEHVYLRSRDNGETWEETGRCITPAGHNHVGFPDGRMVRVSRARAYCYDQGDDRLWFITEESCDGGTTWREISRCLHGPFFYCHRMKKLRDGSLVASGMIKLGFGPGAERAVRDLAFPGEIEPPQSSFLYSPDGGFTWTGPHYVLPGVLAWEADFVELDDGHLLFVNSTVQSGRAVRQVVRRLPTGFFNEPVREILLGAEGNGYDKSGIVPETIVLSEGGLLVGARRGGVYACSNDLGENWHEIADAPKCKYQPMIEALPNGRFIAAWHLGFDSSFGEYDMHIGTHAFALEERVPKATAIAMEQALSPDGDHYVNAFRATLTTGGKPVAGRELVLYVKNARLPEPVWESTDVRKATTDENGEALFTLPDKDAINDIHHIYTVGARFAPDGDAPGNGEDLAPCKGPTFSSYTMSPSRRSPSPYPVYNVHGSIVVTPETAERFPELARIVKHFSVPDPSAPFSEWVDLVGDEARAREIVDFLAANHIIRAHDDGTYHWYAAGHGGHGPGEPFIHDLRVCEIEEHIC